uniref:Ovule protein n=1 Tax=Angiostrongylus cantonensis TaxID=6313 RepID=A0A0K0D7H0_ANGCA
MQNYIDCIRYPIRYECGYRTWIVVREIIVGPVRHVSTLFIHCSSVIKRFRVVQRSISILSKKPRADLSTS